MGGIFKKKNPAPIWGRFLCFKIIIMPLKNFLL